MNLSVALGLVIVTMAGVGYWYYTDTQKRIAILTENNIKLEVAVQQNEEALKSLEDSYASAQQELSTINAEYQSIRRQNQELADAIAFNKECPWLYDTYKSNGMLVDASTPD